jgi:hypothetical protein
MQVKAGLHKIALLDELLADKQAEQAMADKETWPDKWAQRERERLQQRCRKVEQMLTKERELHVRKCVFLHHFWDLQGH